MSGKYFITLAIIITLIYGIIFSTHQQILRQSANDPQIQLSSDIARLLSQGNDINPLLPPHNVDIVKSLSPFVIIYATNQQPVFSTGLLNGKIPSLPSGVLNYSKRQGQHTVTWQPAPGLRYAAVITYYKGEKSGYVLAARSLTETEKRFNLILRDIVIGWGITLGITFILTLSLSRTRRKKHS